MLNQGYVPKANDKEIKFSNGDLINQFWHSYKEKVKEYLFADRKYMVGYEIAKEIINNLEFDKIADYIEMLNQGYIPKKYDNKSKFSNTQSINYFWSDNKEKIKGRLFAEEKYQKGYETAKNIIESLEFDKIADYIEILNTGYIPRQIDKETKFSNGDLVNSFWNNNKTKIVDELLTNERYHKGYEIAKETIKSLNFDKIADYIEMLNVGYIPIYIDKTTKFSNGQFINSFWSNNQEKIKARLFTDEKYQEGYERAKQIINNLKFDKIADYIEMLNQGYIPISRDRNTRFSNGENINSFWVDNKEKIKELLFSDKRYSVGYEKAKHIINNLEFDKIADYIEMLNQGYIPIGIDKKTKFSNGEPINYFWRTNKEKVKERLFNDKRYSVGYEKAKHIINNLEFDKIADYIEMLNQGYIPKKVDNNSKFSNTQSINYFWSDNKAKIKDRLFSDEKYKEGYETAKQIVINKLGLNEKEKELNSGGRKL